MVSTKGFRWFGLPLLALTASLVAQSAVAQSYLNGYWNSLFHEDLDERGPGSELGDYAGLPVTPAAVSVARSWDAEELTLPELQCRPHPSIYGFRAIGMLRIWEVLDPRTQRQSHIETWMMWQSQHRYIWTDGEHPHPPPQAPATWQGFSVGTWKSDVLEVHTDRVKAAWTRRNGLPTSDKATMEERFFRYDDILTHIMMVSDPAYLTEPMVKSNGFVRVENGGMEPYPCSPVDEVERPAGAVPMRLPGHDPALDEWAVRHRVPIEAARGGAQTMLPEYQDYMKKLPPNPSLSTIEKQIEQRERAHAASR